MISVRYPDHFIISDTPAGIRLACPGHFGGMPFDTVDAAAACARDIAGDEHVRIQIFGMRKGKRR